MHKGVRTESRETGSYTAGKKKNWWWCIVMVDRVWEGWGVWGEWEVWGKTTNIFTITMQDYRKIIP
ncbi:MAG: hypothetical protein AAGJ08_24350 [Cyanobacteria bacterium P01_H01_bin.35]